MFLLFFKRKMRLGCAYVLTVLGKNSLLYTDVIRRIRGGPCVGGTVRGTSRASGACERRARAAGEPASVLALAKTRVCLAGRRPPARAMLVSYKTIGFDLNSSEMLFKLFLISGHSEVRRS